MIRSHRSVSILALSLAFAVVSAAFCPATAMAKPPKPFPVKYPYYHHDHFFYGGPGIIVGGPTYVAPVEPVANRAMYTLFFKDKAGQTKVYAQYTATIFDNGATDWGGLIEARDALKAAGVECWIGPGQWVATVGG